MKLISLIYRAIINQEIDKHSIRKKLSTSYEYDEGIQARECKCPISSEDAISLTRHLGLANENNEILFFTQI